MHDVGGYSSSSENTRKLIALLSGPACLTKAYFPPPKQVKERLSTSAAGKVWSALA